MEANMIAKSEDSIQALLSMIAQQKKLLDSFEKRCSDIMFCEAYEQWLCEHSESVAKITSVEYRRIFEKKLEPFFKEFKLKNITEQDIEDFYLSRKREGVIANTILRVHTNLGTFFKWAINKELIIFNPMSRVTRPKIKEKFTSNFFDVDEIKQLLYVARDSKIYTPILISAILGLRRSEVIALKWDVIDFNHKTIQIKRKTSHDRIANIDETLTQLKNSSSYRVLPLPDFVIEYLAELKKENLIKFKNSKDKDFICLDEKGKVLLLGYVTIAFPKLLAKNDLPHIRFHDLRHSCATMLLNLGYSMKEIQEWLGHSTFETTAKYYTHVNMKNKFVLSENLNDIFSKTE